MVETWRETWRENKSHTCAPSDIYVKMWCDFVYEHNNSTFVHLLQKRQQTQKYEQVCECI